MDEPAKGQSLMGHGHSHGHSHGTATGVHRKRLMLVVGITGAVFVAQVIGGLLSGSLALLADAGHMLTDVIGLLIALLASVLAGRPATKQRSFGWQRAEILAALANAVLLTAVAVGVLIQAVARWQQPAEINSQLMLVVAVAGALANAAGLFILAPGKDDSLNIKGAYLEVLGDLLGSLAVIVAALVVYFTGFTRADALAAIVIFLLIVPRAWGLLREVIEVLLESTPPGLDTDELRAHLVSVAGVVGVHDLHVWTITSGSPVLTAHVIVEDAELSAKGTERILDALTDCLHEHFDLSHCTLQLEPASHQDHEHPGHD